LDDSLEEGGGVMMFTTYELFQSLFSWMIRSKGGEYVLYITRAEFQSLFSWMIRSKDAGAAGYGQVTLFQSLFSWMIRSKNPPPNRRILRQVVSILVLLDDSLEAERDQRARSGTGSFNPCSLG